MATEIRGIYEILCGQKIMQIQQQQFKCPTCNEPGIRQAIEKLPKAGLAMSCIHPDGTVHRWAEFSSMADIMDKNKRKSGADPRIILCPKCNHKGRINDYHTDPQRPDLISYVVVHGKIRGKWGTKRGSKISKRDRCYITDREQRDIILKKLRRYIEK
jgi:predicted RNA-binding Zn-ribbon protein involved in translation (DUF1610 family)